MCSSGDGGRTSPRGDAREYTLSGCAAHKSCGDTDLDTPGDQAFRCDDAGFALNTPWPLSDAPFPSYGPSWNACANQTGGCVNSECCYAVSCPEHTTGTSVVSGCTPEPSYRGSVTATVTEPFYTSNVTAYCNPETERFPFPENCEYGLYSPSMISEGKTCKGWPWGIQNRCNKNIVWVQNKFCEDACCQAGLGYGDCPSDFMVSEKMYSCEDAVKSEESVCNYNSNWIQKKFCEKECCAAGMGYDDCPSTAISAMCMAKKKEEACEQAKLGDIAACKWSGAGEWTKPVCTAAHTTQGELCMSVTEEGTCINAKINDVKMCGWSSITSKCDSPISAFCDGKESEDDCKQAQIGKVDPCQWSGACNATYSSVDDFCTSQVDQEVCSGAKIGDAQLCGWGQHHNKKKCGGGSPSRLFPNILNETPCCTVYSPISKICTAETDRNTCLQIKSRSFAPLCKWSGLPVWNQYWSNTTVLQQGCKPKFDSVGEVCITFKQATSCNYATLGSAEHSGRGEAFGPKICQWDDQTEACTDITINGNGLGMKSWGPLVVDANWRPVHLPA